MRRLIVCCDGTWKSNEVVDVTNVVWVVRVLLTGDAAGVQQLIYYDRGVGTGTTDRISGGAFGQGLLDNVKEAYSFVCANYCQGDELFFFGFSRGAYTVRSTVGLIRKCGVLRKEKLHLLGAAYELYRVREGGADTEEARRFREANSHVDVRVHFLGVWDTVGALGIPLAGLRGVTLRRYRFHDMELSGIVKRAYQALAIDEKRGPFKPSIWNNDPKDGQEIEQVWFPGVHSNVGGGYPDRGLSDLALIWMLDRARQAGLAFNEAYLKAHLKPDFAGTLYNSYCGMYLLTVPARRKIGQVNIKTEWVARAAVDRLKEAAGGYDAANLRDFLDAHADRIYDTPTTLPED